MIWLIGASGKNSSSTHARGSRRKPGSWQWRPSAMTDAEAHEYVKRTEAFFDDFFDLLANAKPVNQNAMQLVAIPKTIDGVDYINHERQLESGLMRHSNKMLPGTYSMTYVE